MNQLFVLLGAEHDLTADHTLDTLRSLHVRRVFVAQIGRIPFFPCPRRTEMLRRLTAQVRLLQENGFQAGVWIPTLGYGGTVESYHRDFAAGFTRRIGLDGFTADDAFCPTDARFTDAMCGILRELAATGTDMIMLDDELTLTAVSSLGCACPAHRAMLRQRTGVDAEHLGELLFTGGPNRYREAWLGCMGDTLRDFCRKLRQAVDEVNPAVRMGLASGFTSWELDGVDVPELTRILAGSTRPFLRLTGAPYWYTARRFGRQPLANILETCRQQYAWCRAAGEDMDLFTEGDSYPRSRYFTSAAVCEAFDIGTKMAESCDTLKYFTDYLSWKETGYLQAHRRNGPVYDALAAHFDGKTALGIRVYAREHTVCQADLPGRFAAEGILQRWYRHTPIIPSVNAVPTTYEGEGLCAMAFGDNVRDVDDAAMKRGLILDLSAARILQRQGIDVGLISAEPMTVLKETFGPDTYYAYADRGCCNMTLREGAEVLSTFVGDGFTAPGVYRYENQNGQRFVVYGFDAYEAPLGSGFQLSRGRGQQLCDAVEWLSGTRLPVECPGVPYLYAVCKCQGNAYAAGYLNCTEDDAEGVIVKINVPFDPDSLQFLNCTGRIRPDGVEIDLIRSFGFARIVFNRLEEASV